MGGKSRQLAPLCGSGFKVSHIWAMFLGVSLARGFMSPLFLICAITTAPPLFGYYHHHHHH